MLLCRGVYACVTMQRENAYRRADQLAVSRVRRYNGRHEGPSRRHDGRQDGSCDGHRKGRVFLRWLIIPPYGCVGILSLFNVFLFV